MRLRLKFRDQFHSVQLTNSRARLIELLRHASNLCKIDEGNVQLSLNAKDYFGIDVADKSLNDFGIVPGDVVYVRSLESLDDIKLFMENELSNLVADNFFRFMSPSYCAVCLIAVPVHVFATQKGFEFESKLPNASSEVCDVIRLAYRYALAGDIRITFTVFTNANVLCIAGSVQDHDIKNQLVIHTKDFLVDSTLLDDASFQNPKLVYKQLPLLSICVKDSLIEPILIEIHTAFQLPHRLILVTLPQELLTLILLYLPLNALGCLMLTCREWYFRIRRNPTVWRLHLARLEAKKKPIVDAALSRQQQQQQLTDTPDSHLRTSNHADRKTPQPRQADETGTSEAGENISEDSFFDSFTNDNTVCESYEKFVARYRSLLTQRWQRGLLQTFS